MALASPLHQLYAYMSTLKFPAICQCNWPWVLLPPQFPFAITLPPELTALPHDFLRSGFSPELARKLNFTSEKVGVWEKKTKKLFLLNQAKK